MKLCYTFLVAALLSLLLFQPIYSEESLSVNPKRSVVVIETNRGNIEVELFNDIAPKACENFLSLAKSNYYNNTLFHRVIKGFMIQGGDPLGNGTGGQSIWKKNFEDECVPQVKFDRPGLLAMANRGPNTNGSQFFITTAPTPWLNMHHTIFGEVKSGYENVQQIETTKTGPMDRPVEPQKVLKISVK